MGEGKQINGVKVDDLDCDFHNDNMPLQFDLCIIPKATTKAEQYAQYGLDTNEYKEIHIESCALTKDAPSDKQCVYTLYGQMVTLFRNILTNERPQPDVKSKKKKVDPPSRADDRYVIVVDRMANKMYMYAPRINNGEAEIVRRLAVVSKKKEKDKKKKEEKKKKKKRKKKKKKKKKKKS